MISCDLLLRIACKTSSRLSYLPGAFGEVRLP